MDRIRKRATRANKSNKTVNTKFLQNLKCYFFEYAENTSIHGIRYLGEKKRHILERFWWIIFLGVSLYFCVMLTLKTYHKWVSSPVIVTFATSETPIWKIPFPAVTICPQIKKIHPSYINNFMQNGRNEKYNFTSGEMFDYLDLVCPKYGYAYDAKKNIQSEWNAFMTSCYWAEHQCNFNLFKPTITADGVCYSFNILDREETISSETDVSYYEDFLIPHQPRSQWNLERGYTNDTDIKGFPLRTIVSGISGGLELVFRTEYSDDDYICQDFSEGFKVVFHHPAEIPNTKQNYIRVGQIQDTSAEVQVKMIRTSDDLKSYSREERNCYFSSERKLEYFKIYTQQNCLLECLTNFTYKHCGCVNFYMPRNNSTPICGLGKIWCLKKADREFIENEIMLELQSPNDKQKGCNCLPACYSLNYDAEISQTDWIWYDQESNKYELFSNDTASYSRMQIYFKELQFLVLERNELYGYAEFWANCGGLLGLFFGCSFISLFEFIYFISLRCLCNFRKYGVHYWSGADEIMKKGEAEKVSLNIHTKPSARVNSNHPNKDRNDSKCLHSYWTEYCQYSTVHGLKFLGELNRAYFEKIWWPFISIISIICCLVLITKTYKKWDSSPVIVTFATSETPIWKIPFPAVTVCSEVKGSYENTLESFELQYPEGYGFNETQYLNLVCPKTSGFDKNDSLPLFHFNDDVKYLVKVQPDFYLLVRDCILFGERCDYPDIFEDIFQSTLTQDGVCHTFNMLNEKEILMQDVHFPNISDSLQSYSQWFPESGYKNLSDFKSFPQRTLLSGVEGGLQLTFRTEYFEDDFICENTLGYKVVLHSPIELPNTDQHVIRIGLDRDVSIKIRPKIATISENLKNLDLRYRKCYFANERKLIFFKTYNQRNCLLECFTNFTSEYCGCVSFYMPRFNTTPICGLGRMECTKLAKSHFLESSPEDTSNLQTKVLSNKCNCLPSCHSLSFETKTSQSKFGLLLGGVRNEYFYDDKAQYSRLQIFFNDMQYMTLEKNELFGETDFLANCGGLLGLFVGFSFMSLIELLYFLTLRPLYNSFVNRKN